MFQNLHYTLRTWRHNRALVATILFTLALSVGATTAIFTIVYATLLAPSPYPKPHNLVNIWSHSQGKRTSVSLAEFTDWQHQTTAFSDLNAYSTDNFNVATKDHPQFLNGLKATPGYPAMLGTPLALGRTFFPAEGEPGKANAVILTNRLWQRLGADPKIIGTFLQINGDPFRVVGVMAPGTADRSAWELIVPLVITPDLLASRADRYWTVTARIKDGVTLAQAQSQLTILAAKQAQDFPNTNQGWGIVVALFMNDSLAADRQWTLWLLLGAVAFLLLISCLNVANLMLAQGIARQHEVAIRGALGAQPASIFVQFLTESLLLALISGVLGIAAGSAMLRALVAAIPANSLPPEADLQLNVPILLCMFTVAALSGLLFGVAPAWYAARLDSSAFLKENSRSGMTTTRHWLRRAMIVSEFALALPLLTGAGLTIHSLWNLTHLDLGVRTDNILGCYLDSVSLEKNPTPANVNAYYRRVLARVQTVPGVVGACAMTYLPLDIFYTEQPFSIVGRTDSARPSMRPHADFQSITPGCVPAFGIRIVQGRTFNNQDDDSSPKVAMVNEAFVSSFLNGIDSLQQQLVIDLNNPSAKCQIVGVFHTIKSRNSRADIPEIDFPFWQQPSSVAALAVRTTGDPAAMFNSIASAANSLDPQAALALTRTMTQVHDEVLANDQLTVLLFASFAAVALLLAAIGIYGVMAFSVRQKSREIALRMALGATRNRVVGMVVREGLSLAIVGLLLGLIAAFFLQRTMQSLLFGIARVDFPTLAAVSLLLLIASLFALFLPARKAASTEIMLAVRNN